jgi:DNA-binding MarR family transcriptional regulator
MSDGTRAERLEAAVTALHRASAVLDPIRLRLWDSQGLTVTQLRLLFHVSEHAGGISNAELANRMYVTRPSVSALLDRLERGGFITREIDKDDRRGIRILLQDRGREALSTVSNLRIYTRGLLNSVADTDLEALASAIDALERSRNRLTPEEVDELTKKATS